MKLIYLNGEWRKLLNNEMGKRFRGQFSLSIGIPIFTQVSLLLFLLIPLNIFILLTTLKTNLPTRLFVKANPYVKPAILWDVFFGFWLLINFLCFVAFVADGDHISIFVNLFFTFLLLNLRAGQISKYKPTTGNACL